MNQQQFPLMQASDNLARAIDRLGKNVKPSAENIPSSAIEDKPTVEQALADLDDRASRISERTAGIRRQAGESPGGASNTITFTAPGQGRHCLLSFAGYFTHVYCATTGSTNTYATIPSDSGFTLTKSGLEFTLTRSSTTAFQWVALWV